MNVSSIGSISSASAIQKSVPAPAPDTGPQPAAAPAPAGNDGDSDDAGAGMAPISTSFASALTDLKLGG